MRKEEKEGLGGDGDGNDGTILYRACFLCNEEGTIGYESIRWLILSLALVPAWGIGLLMLLYLPLRRIVVRHDLRSRRLYVTPYAIVYKVRLLALLFLSFSYTFLHMIPLLGWSRDLTAHTLVLLSSFRLTKNFLVVTEM